MNRPDSHSHPATLAGRWLLANLIGGALAGLAESQAQLLGELILAGAILGGVQWLLMRRYGLPWSWLVATGALINFKLIWKRQPA